MLLLSWVRKGVKEEMYSLVKLNAFSYGRNTFRVSLIIVLQICKILWVTYLCRKRKRKKTTTKQTKNPSIYKNKENYEALLTSFAITLLISFLLSLLSLLPP